jgi:ribonuclease P protein component
MRKNLTKAERLKHQSDFDRVFSRGKRTNGAGSRLVVLANGLDGNRFAVCPVRKYGTAVERNRAKRICREAYRNLKHRIEPGHDIILVIRPGTDSLRERSAELEALCRRTFRMIDVGGASS